MGPIFWGESNLMQMYASFEGFPQNSVLVGNILTPVCCSVVWQKMCSLDLEVCTWKEVEKYRIYAIDY